MYWYNSYFRYIELIGDNHNLPSKERYNFLFCGVALCVKTAYSNSIFIIYWYNFQKRLFRWCLIWIDKHIIKEENNAHVQLVLQFSVCLKSLNYSGGCKPYGVC